MADWYGSRSVVRSYHDEVVSKLAPLRDNFDLIKYGALSADPQKYPLWAAKTRAWSAENSSHRSEKNSVYFFYIWRHHAPSAAIVSCMRSVGICLLIRSGKKLCVQIWACWRFRFESKKK